MKLRWILCILLLLFLSVQLFFFVKVGVRQSVDSPFYLKNAEFLKHGIIPEGRALWYSGYALFLSLILVAGGSFQTIVVIQILLSCLAAYCIYLSVDKLSQNKSAGILAILLYMVWIPIHEWETFIYTESLFTSCCVFLFTALLFSKTRLHFVLTALLFLFTFFIRPAGFSLVVALAGYAVATFPLSWFRVVFPVTAALGFIALLIANKMIHFYDPVPSYVSAEIIYPKITLGVVPPEELFIPDNKRPLEKVFFFALYNPHYFLKLFLIKVALFYGNIKPYYSLLHNAAIVLFLYPLYYFACTGFKTITAYGKEKSFIASFILANGLMVGLTTENWDGRFLVPVLPFVFIVSSVPFLHILKRVSSSKLFVRK
jgi:hypothetical protein